MPSGISICKALCLQRDLGWFSAMQCNCSSDARANGVLNSSIIEFLQSWREILSFRSFSWLLLQATGLSRFFTDYYTVFLFLAIPLHQYLSRPHLPRLYPSRPLLKMLRWSRNDWDDSPDRTKYFIPLLHCLRHCYKGVGVGGEDLKYHIEQEISVILSVIMTIMT